MNAWDEADRRRVTALVGRPPAVPEDLCRALDRLGYLDEWRSSYQIRSARVSLYRDRITCIDGAILAYALLEWLFPHLERRLLAIHRRDAAGEECGHCVALYWNATGKVGAFSKSSYPGLGHRAPIHSDPTAVATSYAEAYVKMGIRPLYFGVTALEEVAGDLDWRFGEAPLNELSDRLTARYEYGFGLEQPHGATGDRAPP